MPIDDTRSPARQLFLDAVALPQEDRASWLRRKCGGDSELGRFVESLLAHDQADEDPLERGLSADLLASIGMLDNAGDLLRIRCPNCEQGVSLPADEDVARVTCDSCGSRLISFSDCDVGDERSHENGRIGHFELFEKVGAGGFGSVYRARDLKLERIVAIKIPRRGVVSSTEAERFLREARTAACLRHPNIVSIHEAGCENGTFYIAADFVDGSTLSHRFEQDVIDYRQAATLMLKIAFGLQHAHEHGVIHRDLKPSNVLIDQNGEPHITDFGLAKRVEHESTMTMDGQVLGTPAYMSPEQARGETAVADPRADIYSLGVMLFESLTGERPFRGNLPTLIHQLLNSDAPSPLRFNPHIPSDLATICSKCLETHPNQRYHSAGALADDLLSFLDGRPIQARPIGLVERGWRLARRNPLSTFLAVLLIFSMALGTTASSYFALEMNQKAIGLGNSLREKQQLLRDKESLISDLERSNHIAQVAKDNALARSADADAVLAFLRNKVLSATRPKGQGGGLGVAVTIREAIDEAEPLIAESFREQPEVESAVREALAKTYFDLGDYRKSIKQYRLVMRYQSETLGANAEETIAITMGLIAATSAAGDVADALRLSEKTFVEAKGSLGLEHLLTLQAANKTGRLYLDMGRVEEAVQLLEKAHRDLELSCGPEHSATLSAMDNLAILNREIGKIQLAIDMQQQCIDRSRDTLGPDHSDVLSRMHNLAGTFELAGRSVDAIKLNEKVVALKKDRFGPDHPNTLSTLTNLAMSYRRSNRLDDAVDILRQVRSAMARRQMGVHRNWCLATCELARALGDRGDIEGGIDILQPAIDQAKGKYGPEHPDVCHWTNQLASLYEKAGQIERSYVLREPMLRIKISRARSNLLNATGSDAREQLAESLAKYGANLVLQDRHRDAETICREALEIRASVSPEGWKHFLAMFMLGEAIAGQERYDEAESFLVAGHDGLRAMVDELPDYVAPHLALQLKKMDRFYQAWGRGEDRRIWANRLAKYEQARQQASAARESARRFANGGRLGRAIELYEQAEQLQDQRSAHGLARLYARSLQWSKAHDTFRFAFPTNASSQELLLLYRLGRHDEFRARRRVLLQDYRSVSNRWQYFNSLQAALLLPIDESIEVPVRFLSAVNENRHGDLACSLMVGKAMYRLGEFSSWFDRLPVDSELRVGHPLLAAIETYRRDQSEGNRGRLGDAVKQEKLKAEFLLFDNLHNNAWPEYIERMAWIHEAQRILEHGELSSTKTQEWLDEGVDLLHVAKEAYRLRELASGYSRSGEIDHAIEAFEALAKMPSQTPDPSLIDLYARRGEWQLALKVARRQPGIDWRIPLLLYQLDRIEECRAVRHELLVNPSFRNHVSYEHRHARVAILLPPGEELRSIYEMLADANFDPEINEQWRRILVGPLEYRLGKFEEWSNSLNADSPYRVGTELVSAISRFKGNATADSRIMLEKQVSSVEAQIQLLRDRRDFGKNWPDHIWRIALAHEGRQLLVR